MERNLQSPAAQDLDPHLIEGATALARTRQIRRERILIGTWGGATLLALVATFMLLEGCGSRSSHRTARVTPSSTESTVSTAASTATVVSRDQGLGTEELPGTLVEDPGAVPPDVVATVSDPFVTPGQPIEVAVEGTADITEMALSDGRGDAIPMVKDAIGSTWRVGYRVPLRPGSERLGLAVTAKNQAHRWRRVWVFVEVGSGEQKVEATVPAEDSTGNR
jgi:hypothetical protein